MRTPMATGLKLHKDLSGQSVESKLYRVDRKRIYGSCQFLAGKLVSWSSKKQNCVSTSNVEAEYVAATSCCLQALLMQTQLHDYGYTLDKIPILCDSKSAIAIYANLV
ncbi:hypothetical protein OSB04_019143 [Centaurea solstitialis]|uniref:Uncharacterized protein n=1 Tax=Centaurea solstitialis TaxID=347529 RepID=A0AA38SPQ9_9ASTR|nr:hypothetical protein OSB04_019143 [Centaurea solstitialis]